jgi:excisionase family DNA binding protein
MGDVLTLEEVADYLRVHLTTVRRWCREGQLPALRVGRTVRVRRADLDTWWRERTQAPGLGAAAVEPR